MKKVFILYIAIVFSALLAVSMYNLPAMRAESFGPQLLVEVEAAGSSIQPVYISFRVEGIADLAGYQLTLNFDNQALQFGGMELDDVVLAGRDVEQLLHVNTEGEDDVRVNNDLGTATFGFYSCPFASCTTDRTEQRLAGARGNVYLGTITLLPKQTGHFTVDMHNVKFVDAQGSLVPVRLPVETLSFQVGSDSTLYSPQAVSKPLLDSPRRQPLDSSYTHDAAQQVNYAAVANAALEWHNDHRALCEANEYSAAGISCIDVGTIQRLASRMMPLQPRIVRAAQSMPFVVNSTGDEVDALIGNGICATAAGSCTLRAAIQEANAAIGPNEIHFNVGTDDSVQTIQLTSALPTLADSTGGTTIDGYTQSNSTPNTDELAQNAKILIEVRGSGMLLPNNNPNHDGFVITSEQNMLRGLAIYDFFRPIVLMGSGSSYNQVVGNFIGTDASGHFSLPSTVIDAHGIHVILGASQNSIGTPELADRNVISGNGRHGVGIWHAESDHNVIQNNILGLSPDGQRDIGNRGHGIDMNYGASSTVVGGLAPFEHNVSSGNELHGIDMSHGLNTTDNEILGNFVGTDLSGLRSTAITSNRRGITIKDNANGNTIAYNVIGGSLFDGIWSVDDYTPGNTIYNNWVGLNRDGFPIPNGRDGIRLLGYGFQIGPNNRVAYNGGAGVHIVNDGSDGNCISQNSIYANAGLGIDIEPEGINFNDDGDSDSGPNQQLNFPIIDIAETNRVFGHACANCTVEIFTSDGGDGEYGEGAAFLNSTLADASGYFEVVIPSVPIDYVITASAIDSQGNTSEFALNARITNESGPVVTPAESSTTVTPEALCMRTSVPSTATPVANETLTSTETPIPTNTPLVTNTAVPTSTVEATSTPLVTVPLVTVTPLATPTLMPSPTFTPTLLPTVTATLTSPMATETPAVTATSDARGVSEQSTSIFLPLVESGLGR